MNRNTGYKDATIGKYTNMIVFPLLHTNIGHWMLTWVLAELFVSMKSWKKHSAVLGKEEIVAEVYVDTL
jgi:hypothetical protein